MKIFFVFIFMTTFLFSGNSKTSIEGDWVECYVITSDGIRPSFYGKKILSFYKDKVITRNLNYNLYDGYQLIDSSYFKMEAGVLLFDDDADSIKLVKLTSSELILQIEENQIFFKKLVSFDSHLTIDKIRRFLIGSNFENSAINFEYEYLDGNRFLINDLKQGHFSQQRLWKIVSFKNQFFYIEDDPFGGLLQVKKIEGEKLFFQVYYHNVEEFFIQKKALPNSFDMNLLVGVWEENIDKNSAPPPPLDDTNYFPNEILFISDSTIISKKYFSEKKMVWYSNSQSNKIYVKLEHVFTRNPQWNIINLNDKELIIERRNKNGSSAELRIEQVKFIRKK